jgi:D-amino-acid dehydrogenase
MRVVVVGGGVIGLACAYELRKRGAEVVVLDQSEMGAAASWGNAGWITPSLSGPVPGPGITLTALRWLLKPDSPLYIRPRLDIDFARWMWAFWRRCNPRDYAASLAAMGRLNQRTMELYNTWQSEGVEFEMHCAGLLFAFLSSRVLHKTLEDFDHLQPYGYGRPALLAGDDVRARAPILSESVIGGFMIERERHVEPASLTQGLIRRLEVLGVDLRPRTRVTGFLRRNGRVAAIETDHGQLEGDMFLLAAGAWSAALARLAGFRLPLESGKGYSITIQRPQVQLAHPIYLGEAKVGVSPFAGSLRVAGTMELSGLSEEINARRLAAIRRSIQRFLRGWPAGEGEVAWAGMRPLTPDGLPALGRAPGAENLLVATGHSMLGVTLAPSTGRAMAELMCDGRAVAELGPFNPGRFQRR